MKTRPAYRRLLNLVGGLIALLSIGFVVLQLRHHAADLNFRALGGRVWLLVGGLAVGYGASNSLLSWGWGQILRHLHLPMPWRWVFKVYGLSQLARYLPSNVLQLASRQAMSQAAGLPAWPLAKSAVLELGLLASVGGLFAALLIPASANDLQPPIALNLLGLVVFIGLVGVMTGVVGRIFSRALAQTVLIDVAFLWGGGTAFFLILRQVAPSVTPSLYLVIVGAYVIAWLIGLLTPGAPAGIGIREVVLYALLSPVADMPTILMAVVLGRMTTVSGDCLFFVGALGLALPMRNSTP